MNARLSAVSRLGVFDSAKGLGTAPRRLRWKSVVLSSVVCGPRTSFHLKRLIGRTIHTVPDDFGAAGRAYGETDDTRAGLAGVIDDLLTGQFSNPVRVVAFNTAEGWARDVSEDVAWDVVGRAAKEGASLPESTRKFIEFYIGAEETLRAENLLL
jgi:hypothetical protein